MSDSGIVLPPSSMSVGPPPEDNILDTWAVYQYGLVEFLRRTPGLAEAVKEMVTGAEQYATRLNCRPEDMYVETPRVTANGEFHMKFARRR